MKAIPVVITDLETETLFAWSSKNHQKCQATNEREKYPYYRRSLAMIRYYGQIIPGYKTNPEKRRNSNNSYLIIIAVIVIIVIIKILRVNENKSNKKKEKITYRLTNFKYRHKSSEPQ